MRGWIYLPDRDKHAEIGESVRKLARVCWVKTPAHVPGINDPEHLTSEQIRSLASQELGFSLNVGYFAR